jgi:hypothetical protein
MGEPEGEPGASPVTLAPQCETTETANEINRGTDAPLSPISTSEVAVSETELEDKGTVTLAGEASVIIEVALGEKKQETGAVAGDDNPSVKQEVAEADEVPMVEVELSSVQFSQLVESEALPEAVIAGTEEVVKEEDSQIDHAVKREGDDDQAKLSRNEEGSPAVRTGPVSEEGAAGEVVVAARDDMVLKEEVKVEREAELMDETERKEENVTQTDEEAPHLDQEMVPSETNNKDTDELQPEDNNTTQDEETNMDESMLDDPGGDRAMDEDLTQGDGDRAMDEDLTQGDGDRALDEDLSENVDGDKAMDEDFTQDGDDDKAVNEPSIGVDGGDGSDDADTDDQAAKHEEDVMGTNDGEEDENEDDPPLAVKKGSSGKKKRARPTRIKKGEEELCFICFDGGELVVCDRRLDY